MSEYSGEGWFVRRGSPRHSPPSVQLSPPMKRTCDKPIFFRRISCPYGFPQCGFICGLTVHQIHDGFILAFGLCQVEEGLDESRKDGKDPGLSLAPPHQWSRRFFRRSIGIPQRHSAAPTAGRSKYPTILPSTANAYYLACTWMP